MFPEEKIYRLHEDVFRLFRDLLTDYCGIYFQDDARGLVERRLSRRVAMIGLDDFREYYRYLLYNPGKERELAEIIDILTVNETYFFREMSLIKAFTDEICPELKVLKNEARRLRIWSAGCASGEEPYTIAMLLLDKPALFEGWHIEIIGSDINQRVLQKARAGVYTGNSFRGVEEYWMRKYFTEEGGGWRIKDNVKSMVSFNHVNLLDDSKFLMMGQMDVIFCRNVMIYFHQGSKRKVVESFSQRLVDGGYLLLGHAESLMNVSTAFALKHLKNDLVYQKPKRPSVSISNENLMRMVWGK